MDTVLELIFLTQSHDLSFVFKFRKVCKRWKNYSEIHLTEILEPQYLHNVDVTQFKQLKKLKCGMHTTNSDLQQLPNLIYLDINDNEKISDHGLRKLKLTTLKGATFKITDVGIFHMDLQVLCADPYSKFTDMSLRYMTDMRELRIYGNEKVTDEVISKMNKLHILDIGETNISDKALVNKPDLHTLFIDDNPHITDDGIKDLNLKHMNISESNITDEGLMNKDLFTLNIGINNNVTDKSVSKMINLQHLEIVECNVTDDGIAHLKLLSLVVGSGSYITDKSIENMISLRSLDVSYNDNITNECLVNLQLEKLIATGNEKITDAGLMHMNLYELEAEENPQITDKCLQHMSNLRVLNACDNSNITGAGIFHLKLHTLDIVRNESIMIKDIRHMKLHKLNFDGDKIPGKLKHMPLVHCNLY